MVERRLHDTDIRDPAMFPLRQAAALGAHENQQRYERMEEEIDAMIDTYLETKEREDN